MELIAHRRAAIGPRAARALLDELRAFPKPGLVSLVDNGSHDDMDARDFMRSAFVLRHRFAAAGRLGAQDAEFSALRRWGVEAEVAMSRATRGTNTHRGAIFSLGLLSAAAGAAPATTLGQWVRERHGAAILAHRRDPASHGSAATRALGIGGAQAEAAAGFPSVYLVAIPAYREALKGGAPHCDAAVQAFFALLAHVQDTNLLHRGGSAGLRFAHRAARGFLERGGILAPHGHADALALHRQFVAHGLSPGGSADLLAAALFVLAVDPHAA